MQTERIIIQISTEEREALLKLAERNCRHPRDQARYILRRALGLESSEESSKPILAQTAEEATENKPTIGNP